MEIAEKTKERSSVILAVLSLVIIGATLLASTNQTFRHQREAEEQHLYLTSRAVYLSVERSVRRGPVREGENRLSPQASDFFEALEQDGDVLFVGIIDEHENHLLTSALHGGSSITLPDGMLADMFQSGEWHGRVSMNKGGAYVYAKLLEPLRGMHMSLRDALGPPAFLVVGIDMEKHLGAYAGFRKNVLFQALYILAAALLTWGLGVRFLARRERARKADALELFQAKLLDNLPDGLMTLSAEGAIRSANPAALHILKQRARDLLAKPLSALPGELSSALSECTGKNGTPTTWQQVRFGGAELEILALPLSGDPDNAWLVILRDRTELRTLEKNLADAEKLAAVGALAAGVAHEVRNPLSSLRGFAQYFVKKLAGRAPEEEYAKTMVREADRLNRVITDLLFLGRPKPLAPREVDLEALVREISALLRFDLEKSAFSLSAQLEEKHVFADADALKQALLNLVLNSLDALEACASKEGHWLPLPHSSDPHRAKAQLPDKEDTEALADAAPDACCPALPDPDQSASVFVLSGQSPEGVWIEVRDKGCGMSAKQREHAFEAFFTAKEHGTGLGLALVQRTMLDHGGKACIASEPGRGCTVRLLFPQACGTYKEAQLS